MAKDKPGKFCDNPACVNHVNEIPGQNFRTPVINGQRKHYKRKKLESGLWVCDLCEKTYEWFRSVKEN